jgi:hypothetical protein
MNNFPQITYRHPTLTTGEVTELRPDITLDWSIDVETDQFSDDAQRAALITLLDTATQTVIETEYVSYAAATRRLVIKPASDLDRNKTYRIFVNNQVRASTGRRSIAEYTWEFTTAVGSVSEVTLLNPADSTIQSIFPTLSWNTVTATGTVYYRLQLDDNFNFVNVNYSTITTVASATPAGIFADGVTYYWRVQPYTDTVTGAWSEIWSFYFGSSSVAHVTSNQTWQDADPFGVEKLGFTDGSSNRSSYPTISITFYSTPASDFADYITLTKKAVLPRNDDLDTYDASDVAGSWALVGNVATFTPSEDIADNTKYELTINSLMENTDGTALGETYVYYFTGRYDPYYVDIRVIRARFLSAEQHIPDDLINFYIHQASLEAKARFYGFLQSAGMFGVTGDNLRETVVRDTANLQSYGVLKWVEAATTYHMLKTILRESLRRVGLSRKLGDYSEALDKSFLDAIKLAKEDAKEELDQWEDFLIPSDVPRSVSVSSGWDYNSWNYDWAIGHLARRDDWF